MFSSFDIVPKRWRPTIAGSAATHRSRNCTTTRTTTPVFSLLGGRIAVRRRKSRIVPEVNLAAAKKAHSSVLHFPRGHVGAEQASVPLPEFLTQSDQFVLVAFLLPAQDFPQQGRRA
ncbi:hypothetical protein B0G81_8831 [Paraburkholderia sp. BL6665CI2N2]|nr:hypothetical protein B0G81_8831 [Paraburkholderia sp. BL6665CI2N2]